MNDFFLMERAAQIQRLRSATSGNRIEIPGRMSRVGCSRRARTLYHSIDQICAIPLGEKRAKWLARLAERGVALLGLRRAQESTDDESILLTAQQREVLAAFERQVVEAQLEARSDTPQSESVAMAILRDSSNFDGLKPMQFHSDSFAHELLFVSWLNLYGALVMPDAETNEPRFSQKHVNLVFEFLKEYSATASEPHVSELVGAMTIVANRCPPSEASVIVEQLLNLCCAKEHDSEAFCRVLEQVRETQETAPEFLRLLKRWIVFETAALDELVPDKYDLGGETPRYAPLPESLVKQIRAVQADDEASDNGFELISLIGTFAERGGSFSSEFAEFIEPRSDDLRQWLSYLLPADRACPLSVDSQRLLVRMASSIAEKQGDRPEVVHAFAHVLAPRLDCLHGPYSALFDKEFIQSDSNRDLLLRCTQDDVKRRKVADNLLAHAKKSGDRHRIIGRMVMAAVIDPEYDSEKLGAIGRTTYVLKALEDNGFISSNQLEDLASNLRQRLPDSMEFLVAPYMGASDQEGRLAKLYLALYEECEKFEHYGETGNFGLTTAAYGNLNRTIDRET